MSPRALITGLGVACGRARAGNAIVTEVLKRRFGAADVLLTDSGTSALILALRALVPEGGTIAYPGYACIDLTSAAVGANVRVRLYDLDPATLSPDLESVQRVIDRGVDAIVVAHLYGYPADIVGVQALAAAHGIRVIEDAAQGAGGILNGARLGSLGDISLLSFGRGKGMTAGSGGAVLVRTPKLAEWMRGVRAELGPPARGGREIVALAAQWVFARPLLYRVLAAMPALKLGEMVYKPPQAPRTMRSSAASVLSAALRTDPDEIRARNVRASDILSRMGGASRFRPIRPIAGGQPGFLRLALVDAGAHTLPRTTLGAIRGYPLTLEQHPELRPLLVPGEQAGRGSVFLRDHLFTVPTHSRVAGSDILRLTAWICDQPADLRRRPSENARGKEWRHA